MKGETLSRGEGRGSGSADAVVLRGVGRGGTNEHEGRGGFGGSGEGEDGEVGEEPIKAGDSAQRGNICARAQYKKKQAEEAKMLETHELERRDERQFSEQGR